MARAHVEIGRVVGNVSTVPVEIDGGRGAVAPVVRDMIVANPSRIHCGDRREPTRVPAIAEIRNEEGLGIRNGQAGDRGIDDPILGNPGPELDVVVPRGRCHVGQDPRCGGRGRLAAGGNGEQHRGHETCKSPIGHHGSSRCLSMRTGRRRGCRGGIDGSPSATLSTATSKRPTEHASLSRSRDSLPSGHGRPA